MYNRLLVVYRIKQHPDDLKEKKGCFGIQWPFLVKIRNMYCECQPLAWVILANLRRNL